MVTKLGVVTAVGLTDGSRLDTKRFPPGQFWGVPKGPPSTKSGVVGRLPAVVVRTEGGRLSFTVATAGMPLFEGDLVKCAANGGCTVRMEGGTPQPLGAGRAVTVGRNGFGDGTSHWATVNGRTAPPGTMTRPPGLEAVSDEYPVRNAVTGVRG